MRRVLTINASGYRSTASRLQTSRRLVDAKLKGEEIEEEVEGEEERVKVKVREKDEVVAAKERTGGKEEERKEELG